MGSIGKGFSSMANAKGVGMALFAAIVVIAVLVALEYYGKGPAALAADVRNKVEA